MATPSPRIERLKRDLAANGASAVAEFWRGLESIGTPLIEPMPDDRGRSLVTVVYRGDADTQNVLVMGGIFGFTFPALERLPGSDVWHITRDAENDIRTQYALHVDAPDLVDGEVQSGSAAWAALAQSNAWRADPLNPLRIDMGIAELSTFSVLELPSAAPQPWVARRDGVPAGRVEPHRFTSASLANDRVIWTYLPPGYAPEDAPYPLLVLYDGFTYLKTGLPETLDDLIAEGRIPPMICAMVHQLDRNTELPCNGEFAASMAGELVRQWLPARYRVAADPARTIIGGASYGGLGATFAALRHPDVFGNVLSQSGSYWWGPGAGTPARLDDATVPWQWLTAQYEASARLPLCLYMDVGRLEVPAKPGVDPDMVSANRRLRDVLASRAYPLTYQEFAGGHDYACWRGTLADALLALTAAW